jgi:hypothetical protein
MKAFFLSHSVSRSFLANGSFIFKISLKDIYACLCLALAIGVFAFFQFNAPIMRLHTDPSRWMYEALRVANGDLPYQDFTWQYPPLGVLVVGVWVLVFGASLLSLHAFVTAIGALIVYIFFAVFRCLGWGPWLALGGVLAIIGASGGSAHQRMFSLNLYTPAALCALLGCAVCLLGLSCLREASYRFGLTIFSIGATICFLTKAESALAAFVVGVFLVAAVGILAAKQKVTWFNAVLFVLIMSMPAMLAYAGIAMLFGMSNLMEGISGYGVASSEVDYLNLTHLWGCVSLGVPVSVASFLVAFSCRPLSFHKFFPSCSANTWSFRRQFPYTLASLAIVSSIAVYVALFIFFERANAAHTIFLLCNSGMFVALGVFIGTSVKLLISRKKLSFICSSGAIAVPLISLFGIIAMPRGFVWGIGHYSTPPALSMFYWVLLLILAMHSVFIFMPRAGIAHCLLRTGIFFISLALIAVGNWYSLRVPSALIEIRGQKYCVPKTIHEPLQATLKHIEENTPDRGFVLSAPYGAGINFLLGRISPIIQTQFVRMTVNGRISSIDLHSLNSSSPLYIVIQEESSPILSEEESRKRNPSLWQFIGNNYKEEIVFKNESISFRLLRKLKTL